MGNDPVVFSENHSTLWERAKDPSPSLTLEEMEEERPPKLSWGEARIMPPTVCRKSWQESAVLEGAKDGPPHSWRNVLSTLCVERVEENALHSESSPAQLGFRVNVGISFRTSCGRSPGEYSLLFCGRTCKKSLPTPLPAKESSSLCVCNMPRKVLLTFAARGMEVHHDRHGPRSSPQEIHLKRPKPSKNTVKTGAP